MTNVGKIWWDLCFKCGRDSYEGVFGAVFDTDPPDYPVKCSKCGHENYATLTADALAAGWKKVEDK